MMISNFPNESKKGPFTLPDNLERTPFLGQAGNHNFMDKADLSKELTEDMTRELLIAISYGVPDKNPTAEMSPEDTNVERAIEPMVCDGEEKYRSELISISYSPSPEVKALPLLPVDLDGRSHHYQPKQELLLAATAYELMRSFIVFIIGVFMSPQLCVSRPAA